MLSRDPAYSVGRLGTRNTDIMMQNAYATWSDLSKRVITKSKERQHPLDPTSAF